MRLHYLELLLTMKKLWLVPYVTIDSKLSSLNFLVSMNCKNCNNTKRHKCYQFNDFVLY